MTGRDQDKQLRDLHKVLEISRSLAATVDLDSLLAVIIERSMELLNAERATLFLYDRTSNQLVSRIAAGADEIRFPADRGIAGAAATSRSVVNVPDAYADGRFNPDVDRRTGFRTRNILAVPLSDYESSLVGVLQVLNKRTGPFDDYDIALAETLGAQAGVAIQRANLIDHYLQKQQMQRAMKIARDVQQGLLPQSSPRVCGFDIAGFCQPADETGGDTYDFFPLPDGQWMVVVADASGHGIGPAIVIAETRAMLRAVSLHGCDIATVLETVNNLLTTDLGDARFVTCFFGLLDAVRSNLVYASAGHGPMLFYNRKTDRFQQLAATAVPLGVMEKTTFKNVISHQFAPGDFAVITTDGIFEAFDQAGEPFGIQRVEELLRRDRDLPSASIAANLRQAVADFTAGAPQADDLTTVVIRRR